MKQEVTERVVATSREFEGVRCTIEAEDMRYISSLLRNNYSNNILATIRELYCNAVDATKDNGVAVSEIEVVLPNQFNPNFIVRDKGAGLAKQDVFGLYSKIGRSTKRDSNNSIGSFGIGRLAPLAYNQDGFTITSFHGGMKNVYFMYINEDNDTKIDEIFSGPSDEHSGLCISVSVARADHEAFLNNSISFFSSFSEADRPKFSGKAIDIPVFPKILEGNAWTVSTGGAHACSVVMGGVAYPLNLRLVGLPPENAWLAEVPHLSIVVPIGSVKLHHSREALEYNKPTQSFLIAFCNTVANELKQKASDYFKGIDCLKLAKNKLAEIRGALPYRVFEHFKNSGAFVFNGVPVNSDSFDERYYDVNGKNARIHAEIRCYNKKYNGRIGSCRAYSVPASGKNAYVFNDLGAAADKIQNRMATLLEQGYENVYYVTNDAASASYYSSQDDGADVFYKQNRFDLVKDCVYKLSAITPTKISKPQNAGAPRNAQYYWNIFGRRRITSAISGELQDVTIVKPYIPFEDRLPSRKYAVFVDDKKIRTDIFEKYVEAFDKAVYGVSVVACESKKFAKATDFVDFFQHLNDLWNNTSKEIKQLFRDYIEHYHSTATLTPFHELIESTGRFAELTDYKKTQVSVRKAIEKDAKIKSIIDFWIGVYFEEKRLGFKTGIDWQVDDASRKLENIIEKINKQYKLLPFFLDVYKGVNKYETGCSDGHFAEALKIYTVLEDAKTP